MALAGNIIILFFSVILMSAGFPVLLLILAAGAGVVIIILCFIRMEIMSKRELPFLATLFVMLILFIPIFAITWRTGSYGLNELQISEEDFMYYYNTDISINICFMWLFL